MQSFSLSYLKSLRLSARISKSLLGLALASILSLASVPLAYADVRASDVLLGESIDKRGISVAQSIDIKADYAILLDDSGRVIFERASSEQAKIASMTKIMTALVVLDTCKLEDEIEVDREAASIGESSAQLRAGDILTVHDALKALMVSSGNDAAWALGSFAGSQLIKEQKTNKTAPMEAFVEAMNKKAQSLGMSNSLFTNPHGLDDDEWKGDMHSSAHDVARMTIEAMKSEIFRSLVNKKEESIHPVRGGKRLDIKLESTDLLLDSYEGASGVKTGFTDLAGACFAGANTRNGSTLYSVVMHSQNEATRFTDTQALFNWVYTHRIIYPVAHSPRTISVFLNDRGEIKSENKDQYDIYEAEVPLIASMPHLDWPDRQVDVILKDSESSVQVFDINGNISQEVKLKDARGNIHAGQELGEVTLYQRNVSLGSFSLVAAKDSPAPNIFEAIGFWWNSLFNPNENTKAHERVEIYNDTPFLFDKKTGTLMSNEKGSL